MAFNYTGEPFAGTAPYSGQVAIDTVRFLLGDTDNTDWQLQDGEITGLYANNASDVYQAAIEGCRALAAKYSRQVNKTIGNASVAAETRAQHYRELAGDLLRQSLRHGGAPVPYAGGISKADMENDEANDDLMQPNFGVGMHDDPGSSDVTTGAGFTQVVPG